MSVRFIYIPLNCKIAITFLYRLRFNGFLSLELKPFRQFLIKIKMKKLIYFSYDAKYFLWCYFFDIWCYLSNDISFNNF